MRKTWIGIGAAEHERLFEPFTQADTASTRKHGGIGLGLALARAICRRLGGDLTLERGVAVGATFTLWLALGGDPRPGALPFSDSPPTLPGG